ncbi:MAG: hypothetical protein N2449_09070 [Bacteroidales bacterium]|nr:hypothetical protein [Bacteroidales bacterium]
MKCRLLFIFILFNIHNSYSQSIEDKYKLLRQTFDTIKIDSLTFSDLYGSQLDEIFLDLKQINEAYRFQIDSLTSTYSKNNALLTDLNNKNKMFLYLLIASCSILLIIIIVLIIILLKKSVLNKKYQHLSMENGKLIAEIDKIKQLHQQEQELYKEHLQKNEDEKQKLTAKIQQIQQEIKTHQDEKMQMQEKINELQQKNQTLHNELMNEQTKCEELSAHVNDLLELKREKELLIEQLKAENLQLKEIELKDVSTIQDLEKQIEELKAENNELLQRVVKAAETEQKVNNELKKFIAELQAMLPLPKHD